MSQEFYKIITDEDELNKFIDWLPDCEPHEQYYFTLFSRKKYAPENPACAYDKTQLKRGTATKDRLYYKLRQLECPLGSYTGAKDLPVPQEALAAYISINPRDLYRSHLRGIKALAEQLEKHTPDSIGNPHQEMMNMIQTTRGRTRYHVFDLDTKEPGAMDTVRNIVNDQCAFIETNGGYHAMIPNNAVHKIIENRQWYVKIKELADVSGDMLTPIPGTYQGGHTPRLIKETK